MLYDLMSFIGLPRFFWLWFCSFDIDRIYYIAQFNPWKNLESIQLQQWVQ